MKVCKKCKTKVANKARICKKCGADVSKAKIIKNNNSQNTKKTNTKAKTIKNQKKPIEVSNPKKQKQVVVTKEQNKNNSKKQKLVVNHKYNNKKKAVIQGETLRNIVTYVISELVNSIKTTIEITYQSIVALLKFIIKSTNSFIKTLERKILENKIKRLENKKVEENKTLNIKIDEKENEIPKKVSSKRKKRFKIAFAVFFISILCGVAYYTHQYIYEDVIGKTNEVVVGEKATTDKVFSMNDVITYNDVDYKIVKIETSKGNNYKSPKEGHQFLIVSVYIKNNSNKKIPYSYENWTMSNSRGEEKKRIFTSINVDTALYSGELVVGGIKTGSMVFEQPINDKKLKMNYYELKKDKDGNEVIDESKRVFSVSVKVPEKDKTKNNNPDQVESKIIKNS